VNSIGLLKVLESPSYFAHSDHWPAMSLHCALASCGAVYCNRSCLWVCNGRAGGRAGDVCYHDNSKLHGLIFNKLGL